MYNVYMKEDLKKNNGAFFHLQFLYLNFFPYPFCAVCKANEQTNRENVRTTLTLMLNGDDDNDEWCVYEKKNCFHSFDL